MLLHEALDFEESWQQVPLVPGSVYWVRQRLVIIEGFQQRVERVNFASLRGVRMFVVMVMVMSSFVIVGCLRGFPFRCDIT
jgi:hypothetical protein